MPEAVIVSTARSPIGRAMKGSLVSIRPDDLAAQMVRAALDKVEGLNPHQIDDLILGCGLPGGEQGFNMARVVAIELGYDFLPGTTVNRYWSSSLQTIPMAFHAIKAGEGDAFISAGVETVSRFVKGNSDSLPDTKNPLFDEAAQRTVTAAEGATDWHDPRKDHEIRGLEPAQFLVQVDKSRRHADRLAAALERGFGVEDGGGQRLAERLESAFGLADRRQLEQFRFGALDLLAGRVVEILPEGIVDDILADPDQLPAQMQIVNAAAVFLGIDDRHRRLGEPGQVLRAADLG